MSKYKHGNEETYKTLAKTTAEMLPKHMEGKLLDIGCYKGYLRKYLPLTVKYIGLDLDKWFSEVVKCDLNNGKLPFKTNEFDFVIVANVLEHIFYPDKICEEIRRILKPRGMAIISLPNDLGISSKYSHLFEEPEYFEKQKYGHHWIFSVKTAKRFIGRYFKIIDERCCNEQILSKFDFILKHFPTFCTIYYMKVIQKG